MFDEVPISVIASDTVREIGRVTGQSLDVRRFRPNVVVRLLRSVPFQEGEWLGGVLSFGEADDGPAVKAKTVHIQTDPPGAIVKIDQQEIHTDDNGIGTATLTFRPVDDRGDLKTYEAVVSKKTADTEWIPED